ncbi:hypothetical protein ACQFX9_18600 [Aliinostoc sp. HNIBRCY26]|uniref:hypothetical protein n=1 Tax=Aliinostoc sp. HNIBRCY26 TaxID=3418997 RepID=UPI003CFF6E50
MTQVKRGIFDWIVLGLISVFTLMGLVWWILQPTPETKAECYQRVSNEITSRKKALGETSIKDQQEIEAIASEMQLKCR